ncbi:MAG TPA: cell division regulator GpsB [Cerasibacillus sp.]|uniref:cell division regulator GpsB n=1 Tax=Cerasibacillus sp. TaxID=2498711 RepID=UPI002F3FCAD0
MADKKIQFTSKDILEKEFKVSMRGYNQDEVDSFLDKIILDYQLFNEEIMTLKKEISRLKKQNTHKEEVKVSEPTRVIPPSQVNYDVLKRLSNLEKAVFGTPSRTEDDA